MILTTHICIQYTDEELIKLSVENMDNFSCIYQRYESKLLRYIHRISEVNQEEAEDILQEAFLKIWKNLHAFQHGMKVSSWLYRIVHNETVSNWRRSSSGGKKKTEEIKEEVIYNLKEDLEIEEESINQLIDILQIIQPKYKEIIVLKYFEEMSYEEISDVLKIPEGTVAVRLNRAKSILKNIVITRNQDHGKL